MVFLCFSYAFPMLFLWLSYGFPMVFVSKIGAMINFQHQAAVREMHRVLRPGEVLISITETWSPVGLGPGLGSFGGHEKVGKTSGLMVFNGV